MAFALELHREIDFKTRLSPVEKEMRRRLFWTCYLMDRFTACGSKRPSLIADESIVLRLPSWCASPTSHPVEGEFFQNGSNLQYLSGSGKKSQGSSGMLIDIVRVLGITNRYLIAGGVKGDSHFPWHSLSNLSKIRQDLDIWASGNQDFFSSVDTLFGQPDSSTLVLSKLIYHLVHCLIYRPFLPIDLAELAGTGQHQSWQIEATNLCFLHANAIAELIELGKQSSSIEWPAFVGYCICTAGTVHVHGAHYKGGREGEVFVASADFLSREMQQLSELRYAWASVQHQRETLQAIYASHSKLCKSLASNPMRYSPAFHLEDFFDRYSDLGGSFDGAHNSLADINLDPSEETYQGHDIYASRTSHSQGGTLERLPSSTFKHRTSSAIGTDFDQTSSHRSSNGDHRNDTGALTSPNNMTDILKSHPSDPDVRAQQPLKGSTFPDRVDPNMTSLSQIPFSPLPSYAFPGTIGGTEPYDSMFGMPGFGNAISSPVQGTYGYNIDQQTAMTPGGRSNGESSGTTGEGQTEKDPFLSLLEQLAENEHSRGGPSELDFFLNGGTT